MIGRGCKKHKTLFFLPVTLPESRLFPLSCSHFYLSAKLHLGEEFPAAGQRAKYLGKSFFSSTIALEKSSAFYGSIFTPGMAIKYYLID